MVNQHVGSEGHLANAVAKIAAFLVTSALVGLLSGCGSKPESSGTAQVVTFNYSTTQMTSAKGAQADLDLLRPMTLAQRQAYLAQHPDVASAVAQSPSQLQKLQFKAMMAGSM